MNNKYILFLQKYQNSFSLSFLLLLSLIYVAYITWGILGIGITPGMDDPYIIDHSVNDILNNGGKESRFFDSSPWDGITSPVFFGLTLLFSLIMPVVYARLLLATISILLLILGLFILGKRYKLNNLVINLIILFSISSGVTTYQLLNGLETGMAMATIPWIVIALDEIEQGNKTYWGYVLVGIICYIRPELAALSFLFGLFIISEKPKGYLMGLFISLFSFISFSLVLYIASGNIITNTMSAKTYFLHEGCVNFKTKFFQSLRSIEFIKNDLGLFSLGFLLIVFAKKYRAILISFMLVFLLAYIIKLPKILYANFGRYAYLMFPIAIIGWFAFFNKINNTDYKKISLQSYFLIFVCFIYAGIYIYIYNFDIISHLVIALFCGFISILGLKTKFRILQFGGLAISILFILSAIFYNFKNQVGFIIMQREATQENFEVSQWIEKNSSPDEVILIHDAGLISEIGKNPLVDMVGLKTRFVVKVNKDTIYKECRVVPKTISDIAKNTNAKYVIVTNKWDYSFKITDSLKKTGWSVERADKERIDISHWTNDYHYMIYKITPPKS